MRLPVRFRRSKPGLTPLPVGDRNGLLRCPSHGTDRARPAAPKFAAPAVVAERISRNVWQLGLAQPGAGGRRTSVKVSRPLEFLSERARQSSGLIMLRLGAGYGWSSSDHGYQEFTGAPSTAPARERSGGLDGHNHSPGKPPPAARGLFCVQPWLFNAHRHAPPAPCSMGHAPTQFPSLFSGDRPPTPQSAGMWMDSACQRGRRSPRKLWCWPLAVNQLVAHLEPAALATQRGVYPRHFWLGDMAEARGAGQPGGTGQGAGPALRAQPRLRYPGSPLEHRSFFSDRPFRQTGWEFSITGHREAILAPAISSWWVKKPILNANRLSPQDGLKAQEIAETQMQRLIDRLGLMPHPEGASTGTWQPLPASACGAPTAANVRFTGDPLLLRPV